MSRGSSVSVLVRIRLTSDHPGPRGTDSWRYIRGPRIVSARGWPTADRSARTIEGISLRGPATAQLSVGSILARRASKRRTDQVHSEIGTRRQEHATSPKTSATGERYRPVAARSWLPGQQTAARARCPGVPKCCRRQTHWIPNVEGATEAHWPSHVALRVSNLVRRNAEDNARARRKMAHRRAGDTRTRWRIAAGTWQTSKGEWFASRAGKLCCVNNADHCATSPPQPGCAT